MRQTGEACGSSTESFVSDFADHLNNWCSRHGYTSYRAAKVLGLSADSLRRWRAGKPCIHEAAIRALMAAHEDTP